MRRQANPLNLDPITATKPVAWRPNLAKQKGETKHAALTERIIADIDAGVLKPMDRMPTHRAIWRVNSAFPCRPSASPTRRLSGSAI